MVEVRLARSTDAAEIIRIYAPVILHSATSFETTVPSEKEMEDRIQNCLQKYPWIVCVVDGSVAAYVYASKHREREAYQWSCECSVYVDERWKGKGIGAALYENLFDLLKFQGFRNVYAGITLPNNASVRLHEKCGFRQFATYENIGYKFGKWHSVGWWKLRLNDHDAELPPPLQISALDAGQLNAGFSTTARRIQSALID